jgi:DNA polymerase-1
MEARSALTKYGQLKAWRPFADMGRVQATWDSLGTPHGRYTSDGPCLNNRIPPIRETIEADPGYSFLSLDLGQAELVSWASLSGDPELAKSFREEKDFHLETALSIKAAVPSWDLRDAELRDAGKTLNFAILYQMKASTLASKLGCSLEIAERIISAYYRRFPKATAYIRAVLAEAKVTGYVQTYFGRRRFCPEYQTSSKEREVHEVEKTIWNHVNCGSAAELLKKKQILAWEDLRKAGYGENDVRLVIQNYDECIWLVRDSLLKEVQERIEAIWKTQEKDWIKFKVDVKSGKTWKECS